MSTHCYGGSFKDPIIREKLANYFSKIINAGNNPKDKIFTPIAVADNDNRVWILDAGGYWQVEFYPEQDKFIFRHTLGNGIAKELSHWIMYKMASEKVRDFL
ncbi:MAG: hypothetical protein ACD_84C00038G0001 [uncultured bacterium]|nr:MAG: hypothetical protein ACD_84C00038G0001 [uncultured bacterium]